LNYTKKPFFLGLNLPKCFAEKAQVLLRFFGETF